MELSIPFFWRLEKQRYRLVGSRCDVCSKITFPNVSICPSCGGKNSEFNLSGKGKIISWTIIHVSPEGFEAPYGAAIIELEEGPMIASQIVGNLEKIYYGCPVKAVFRKIRELSNGFIIYGLKFEIVESM